MRGVQRRGVALNTCVCMFASCDESIVGLLVDPSTENVCVHVCMGVWMDGCIVSMCFCVSLLCVHFCVCVLFACHCMYSRVFACVHACYVCMRIWSPPFFILSVSVSVCLSLLRHCLPVSHLEPHSHLQRRQRAAHSCASGGNRANGADGCGTAGVWPRRQHHVHD